MSCTASELLCPLTSRFQSTPGGDCNACLIPDGYPADNSSHAWRRRPMSSRGAADAGVQRCVLLGASKKTQLYKQEARTTRCLNSTRQPLHVPPEWVLGHEPCHRTAPILLWRSGAAAWCATSTPGTTTAPKWGRRRHSCSHRSYLCHFDLPMSLNIVWLDQGVMPRRRP